MRRLWTGLFAAGIMAIVAATPARADDGPCQQLNLGDSEFESGLRLCIQPSLGTSSFDGNVIVQVDHDYHCAAFTFGRPNLAQQWIRGPR